MGVMGCHRVGCEEIMCGAYVPDIGYICHTCQGEFQTYAAAKKVRNEEQLKKHLKKFMGKEKNPEPQIKNMDIGEYFWSCAI